MLLLLDFISEMLNVSCGQNTRLAFIHSMNNHQSLRDLVMHNQSRAQWLDRGFQEAMLLVLEFCEISLMEIHHDHNSYMYVNQL